MDQKALMIKVLELKFGVKPTDAQLTQLQKLAKNEKLTADQWVTLAEKVLKG